MARRTRRQTPDGEFQDPLKNYDPPAYTDDLDRALIEDDLSAMQTGPVATIQPTATIEKVMSMMVDVGIACVMVTEGDRLLGLFSERDVLNKVADNYQQLKDRPVSEVMTVDPIVAYETNSPATVLNLMAVHGFRHVPVLDADDNLVGIVGPRRVTAYLQKSFTAGA